MTRPHFTADHGTYIGLTRGRKNSPDAANETTGWLRPLLSARNLYAALAIALFAGSVVLS
ncbi:hypothetical protein ACQVP2_07640 [Methylobacterium aquaticum]|uniref:hypothetical protein n=1 Tax=Methylobacterium aquaticum TaxID=270351 RepID=UPI003D179117